MVKDILVKTGDKIKVGQVVFTVEGDSTAQPQAATPAPVSRRTESPAASAPVYKESPEPVSGQHAARLAYQSALAVEGKSEEEAFPPDRPPQLAPVFEMPSQLTKTAGPEHQGPIPAAPHVRRLARELGVDIYQVKGSGPGGRISEDDVKALAKSVIAASQRSAAAQPAPVREPAEALPDFAKWGKVERVSMRGVRRKTAEHLAQAWTTIPHVTQHDKADITAARTTAQALLSQSRRSRWQADRHRHCVEGLRLGAEGFSAVQRQHRHGEGRSRLQAVHQYRRCGRYRSRAARAGDSRRRHKEHHRARGGARRRSPRKPATKNSRLTTWQGGTFTITNLGGIGGYVLHADRELAGSRHSRHVALAHGAGLLGRTANSSRA